MDETESVEELNLYCQSENSNTSISKSFRYALEILHPAVQYMEHNSNNLIKDCSNVVGVTITAGSGSNIASHFPYNKENIPFIGGQENTLLE